MSHKNPGTSLVSTFDAELLELCLAPCTVSVTVILNSFPAAWGKRSSFKGEPAPFTHFGHYYGAREGGKMAIDRMAQSQRIKDDGLGWAWQGGP
jgi:hypothetical protein